MVWDIFDEMRRMQEEMDRMFEGFFRRPRFRRHLLTSGERGEIRPMLREAFADVQETDKEVIITAELPGMDKEDISVDLTSDYIKIKAEKKSEKRREEKEGYAYSRMYQGFYRTIPLPSTVDPNKAKATYKHGVLEIMVPKTEISISRKLKID
ncbi:MAG: Hsp20/alpha crystallin family protein [Candidatus Methanofastidiosia archaeon]